MSKKDNKIKFLCYNSFMKALIVKKLWIDYILDGNKVWEIRGSNTKIRGEIELIQSGTGLVVGKCNLIDCIELFLQEYQKSKDKHCIYNVEKLPYKKTFAWVINDAQRYPTPRKYKHPKGAIIWVNL